MSRTRLLIVGLCLLAANARADETRGAIFSDSAAVLSVRPAALANALRRLGSGWEVLARQVVPLPPAVSPLDPTVLTMTGIDANGSVWIGVRALRGGLHLRGVVPLVEPHVADALLSTVAHGMSVELAHPSDSLWTGKLADQTPIVVRLDGRLLLVDVVLAGATSVPTPADIARVVPLHPPHAWMGTRGMQKNMRPADAVALWADLDAVAKVSLQRSEAQLSATLHNVEAAHRTPILRQAQKELASCKSALNAVPHTFDDALLALSVENATMLRLELTTGGRRTALDPLQALRDAIVPTRALPNAGTPDVRLFVSALPLAHPVPGPRRAIEPSCSPWSTTAELLWGWPSLWSSSDVPPWARLLGGLRSVLVTLPMSAEEATVGDLVAFGELDPARRSDLDVLLDGRASGPQLRIGSRDVPTYATPNDRLVATVDPSSEPGRGTLLGLGDLEQLRPLLERPESRSGPHEDPIATLRVTPHGLRRLVEQIDAHDRSLVDGVTQLDGRVQLEPELVRANVVLTLAPHK